MTDVDHISFICNGCGFIVAPYDGQCPLQETRECEGPDVHGTYELDMYLVAEWEAEDD